jgi:leader peptidase (prepilin peptidase)/N-methyltransferase
MTSFLVTAGTATVAGIRAVPLVATAVGQGDVTGLAGVLGLLIGSFLNVVVYRVPRHLSVVEPRSFCPGCETPLRSFDNIPLLSWIFLGGRCRQCRTPISVRYPLVELATGVVFATIAWGLGPHWAVAGFCVLGATLVVMVAVEADGLAPPLSVAVIGTSLATVLLVAAGGADHRWGHVLGLVIAVAVAAVVVAGAERGNTKTIDAGSPGVVVAAPVLLPVAAALGWLGPVYLAEGLAVAVVLILVARIVQTRPSSSERRVRAVAASALAAGAVVATVLAVTVGSGAGR